jgi:hypothetical protein
VTSLHRDHAALEGAARDGDSARIARIALAFLQTWLGAGAVIGALLDRSRGANSIENSALGLRDGWRIVVPLRAGSAWLGIAHARRRKYSYHCVPTAAALRVPVRDLDRMATPPHTVAACGARERVIVGAQE